MRSKNNNCIFWNLLKINAYYFHIGIQMDNVTDFRVEIHAYYFYRGS